jgi:hypothetical protein
MQFADYRHSAVRLCAYLLLFLASVISAAAGRRVACRRRFIHDSREPVVG